MDRLTYWNEDYGCWSYHCPSGNAAIRLCKYEDNGQTPEEQAAMISENARLKEQLSRVTAERTAAAKTINCMADYIVTYGRVDYHLCDEIPKGLHLKYQPKNDGNYENAPCIKCVAEYFMRGLEEGKK